MLRDISEMFNPKPLAVMGIESIMTEDTNISYVSWALDMCRENQAVTHRLISQVISEDAVNEGLIEDNTFVNVIKSIINWFIEKLKELADRFIYVINKFVGNRATIEKYGQQILAFDKPITIPEFKHFRYTNLDANIPPAILNTQFMTEYSALRDHLTKIGRETDKSRLLSNMNGLSSSIRNTSKENLYAFRGSIVGEKTDISPDGFSDKLFRVFRNGDNIPSYNPITPQEITESFRRYKNSKILIDGIKKQEKEMRANAESVKKNIKDIKLSDVTNGRVRYDYELETALNNILQSKCEQIAGMCTAMTIAFAAKMDAIKDAVEQDKRVLYAVIGEIIGV